MELDKKAYQALWEQNRRRKQIYQSLPQADRTFSLPAGSSSDGHLIRTRCRQCHQECGLRLWVEDGQIVRLEGDPDDPRSEGRLCAKGNASLQVVYHPDRLTHPLRRVGPRGSGEWQRLSWDEALDEIAERLLAYEAEFGAESVVFSQGTSRDYSFDLLRLCHAFGTPNFTSPSNICHLNAVASYALTTGYYGMPDWKNARCVVMWANNWLHNQPSRWGYDIISGQVERGAKLLVVDSRLSVPAAKADLWLAPRPGSDGALALGLLHVIIREGLYDRAFVETWTHGFDELAELAEAYPPARVQEITWVDQADVVRFAREYARNRPAAIAQFSGTGALTNAFQTSRAIVLLSLVCGNYDVPGGEVACPGAFDTIFPRGRAVQEYILADRLSKEQWQKMLGRQYRVTAAVKGFGVSYEEVVDAILTGEPYPIKAMIAFGGNDPLHYTNSQRVVEALQAVDFSVAVNLFMVERCQLADVVLPASHFLERSYITAFSDDGYLFPRVKATQVGECKPDTLIMCELARRLGLGEAFPWQSMEAFCDEHLRQHYGISWDAFVERGYLKLDKAYRKYEKKGFRTPSGKAELYSLVLERMGYDPLPVYREPMESPVSRPDLAEDYPLILLTSIRPPGYYHTELRQVGLLRELEPLPRLEINPRTAAELDIEEGDPVWVESPRGRMRSRAQLTEEVPTRVVASTFGWSEANPNALTDSAGRCPETGTPSAKSVMCRVYRAKVAGTDVLEG